MEEKIPNPDTLQINASHKQVRVMKLFKGTGSCSQLGLYTQNNKLQLNIPAQIKKPQTITVSTQDRLLNLLLNVPQTFAYDACLGFLRTHLTQLYCRIPHLSTLLLYILHTLSFLRYPLRKFSISLLRINSPIFGNFELIIATRAA